MSAIRSRFEGMNHVLFTEYLVLLKGSRTFSSSFEKLIINSDPANAAKKFYA